MKLDTPRVPSCSVYRRLQHWERSQPVISFVLELLFVLCLFFYLGYVSVVNLPIAIQWHRIPAYFSDWSPDGRWLPGSFLLGLVQTLKLSALALLLTMVIGYFTALCALSPVPSTRLFAKIYIQLIRNTPLLVQLYVAYFLFSPLLGLSSFVVALLVLGFFEGAYTAEIMRNAIQNIPLGQIRAAKTLGFSSLQIQLLITHPQALRNAMPILANQGVSLIKDSALASAIGVFELARSAQHIQEQSFLPFEPWLGVCLIYFILTFSLSMLIRLLENKA